MAFLPQALNDPNFHTWLRPALELAPPFAPLINEIVDEVHAHANIRPRRDARLATATAVSVLLANLLRAHQHHTNLYVALSLDANSYLRNLDNPAGLSSRAVRRVVDYLVNSDPALIDLRPGGQFRDGGRRTGGFVSRIRMTDALLNRLLQIEGLPSPLDAAPHIPSNKLLFIEHELPIIRLRNADGNTILFAETEETRGIYRRLAEFNEFLKLHWIDILKPDGEFAEIADGNNPGIAQQIEINRIDLVFQRTLYRVFNNGIFGNGGRFYGGWWQSIPSEYRRYITINWVPTVELDYSNMQAAMLYAMEGFPLEGDAYQIDGIDPGRYRRLIKKTFFKLINATGRMRAPTRAELPEGWNWSRLRDAIREKHQRIARHFGTGIGIRLQRIDSDIAEDVMMTMMRDDDLALPVHDSFRTYFSRQERLRTVMQDAYVRRMRQTIGIDADPSFLEIDMPEAVEHDATDIRPLEDTIEDLENRQEYRGYRARQLDFMASRDDAWRWRFRAHP